MSKPRLTKRILNGLSTALAHANAGGPADLGLCPDSEEAAEAPEVQRRMQEVADAFEWVQGMWAARKDARIKRQRNQHMRRNPGGTPSPLDATKAHRP